MESLKLTDSAETDTSVDLSETDAKSSLAGRLDIMQLAFWGCLLLSIAAASIALAWPSAVGATGPVLLIAMAAGGLVFLLWIVRGAGRRLGLFPDCGAAANAAQAGEPRFGWIEALDESILIADRGGSAVVANSAYY